MFKFYTNDEEQRFESKAQAVDFYTRIAYCCEGSERDRYCDYTGRISASNNSQEVKYKFSGNVKQILVYNSQGDYLQEIK